jgi:hypothetical protein
MNNIDDRISLEKQVEAACPAHLHRVNANDAFAAKQVLLLASLGLMPIDKTQRKLFSEVMPLIYMLRKKEGYTFKRVTTLLKDCGFKLTQSSVRVYYYSLLAEHEEEYIKTMDEKMALMSEIIRETQDIEFSAISGKVAEIMERKRLQDGF